MDPNLLRHIRRPAKYGYDFHVAEGSGVYAMEDGIVVRLIGHFQHAYQDSTRMQGVVWNDSLLVCGPET